MKSLINPLFLGAAGAALFLVVALSTIIERIWSMYLAEQTLVNQLSKPTEEMQDVVAPIVTRLARLFGMNSPTVSDTDVRFAIEGLEEFIRGELNPRHQMSLLGALRQPSPASQIAYLKKIWGRLNLEKYPGPTPVPLAR